MRNRIPSLVAGAVVTAGAVALGLRKRRVDERQRVLSEFYGREIVDRLHRAKLDRVAARLRTHDPGTPLVLAHHGSRLHAPPSPVVALDLDELSSILEIDPVHRTCTAESGVRFEDLVAATSRYGLVPVVVPEQRSVTLGGAVSGHSHENSFRYGGFHDSCLEYEVLTANGEALVCTPENSNALVFQMMNGAFGTLGILTRLTFRLVPAKPFVLVIHERFSTMSEFRAAIRRHFDANDLDFLDGVVRGPEDYELAIARFVDAVPHRTRADDTYMATPAYLFRRQHPRGRWQFARTLLGKIAEPTTTLDVFLPMSRLDDFMVWYERDVAHYPLWCVPYRRVRESAWLADNLRVRVEDELYLDIVVHGLRSADKRGYHRTIERQLRRLGGVKTLVSHNYYERGEFWSIWNKRNYDLVKAQTDPRNVFRDLYTKTCRSATTMHD